MLDFPNSPQATVLVVDDEDDLREAMRRMLERRGFQTLSASDSASAESLCAQHDGTIDVLLTDLGLPTANGGDLARCLVELRPGLRVVYVSGLPKEVAVDKGLLRPEDQLVQKPFTSDSLVDAVRATLRAP